MFNLLFLFLLSTVFVLAWKAQHLRAHTIHSVRRYCEKRELYLLDETVVLKKRYFKWTQSWATLQREWYFEFTSTGEERYQGKAYTVGDRVTHITLPPHKLTPYDTPNLH